MSAVASRHPPYVRDVGDSALLLEVGATHGSPPRAVIDARVNARAIAIAAAVRQRAIPGVRDVVSTFRSVAVFFDPLATDVAAVAASLHEASAAVTPSSARFDEGPSSGRTIEVPVAYGGELGPDLDDVAAFAGCSQQAVIDRHTAPTYRVFMLGFLPGFAYMASVDETIAMPRRAAPRLRVAAGSVGIAGRQTAIYPRESPGGWQIVGRTPMAVFDPARTPPSLFSPGDQVRFVPADASTVDWLNAGAGFSRLGGEVRPKADPMAGIGAARHITVLRHGLLTTVQDSGRWGYQDRGVSASGPMDPAAHRLANAIVANPRDAATLEATLLGPELRIEQDTTIAVAGADLHPIVDRSDIPMNVPIACRGGSVLRFGNRRAGVRAYMAFDGGIDVPPVLGSRATHLLSGLGGIDGRAVRAGDRIPLGAPTRVGADVNLRSSSGYARPHNRPMPLGGARLRILPGPQADYFAPDAFEVLQRVRFVVSPHSDRVGYRLTGDAPVRRVGDTEMISDATFLGGVQVPPSGEPILLMADRQTTGGYPQLAIVISADLPLAAQLAPGDWVEFQVCTRAEAVSALIAQEGKLLAVR